MNQYFPLEFLFIEIKDLQYLDLVLHYMVLVSACKTRDTVCMALNRTLFTLLNGETVLTDAILSNRRTVLAETPDRSILLF